MITVQNYVNGTFVSTKETIEDINPATGEIIANIRDQNQMTWKKQYWLQTMHVSIGVV